MAESILKLKVDSQEYNNKIKRAAEGIQAYAQKCREAGGTLEFLDDGVLEFVQALGKMDTVSTSTKQQVRELSNALTTLTMTYRGLTDEEKASPFGQELAKGIQQLTERAGQARDAMADVERSIKGAASDTRIFDQVAQGMSVATAGFQGLTGAGKLLGIEMGNDVEIIAKLQAAMAVTNSLTTIQNALQKESALMMGVVSVQTKAAAIAQSLLAKETIAATVAGKAFNIVAKANPIGLVLTTVAAAATAFGLFSSSEDTATESSERFNNALDKMDGKLKDLETSFQNLISYMQQIGSSSDVIDDLRKQAADEEVRLAREEYMKLFNGGLSGTAGRIMTSINQNLIPKEVQQQALDKLTAARERQGKVYADIENKRKAGEFFDTNWNTLKSEKEINAAIGYFKNLRSEVDQGTDAWNKYNDRITALQAKLPKTSTTGGRSGNTTTTTTTPKETTEAQQLQKNIEQLTKEYQQLSDVEKVADINTATGIEMRKAAIRGEIQANQQRIDELKKFADEAKNVLPKNQEAVFKLTVDKSKLDSLQASIAKLGDKSIKVNVEQGTIDLPNVPTDDETIKVNVEQGTIDLPNVPTDDETIKVNVEQGTIDLPNVPTDDETIKVNVEPGEVNIPEVPEQYTMTITADTSEALQKVQGLVKDVDGRTLTFKTKVDLETGISGTNESSISAYVKKLQDELADIDYSVAGSFQKALDINSNIIDANTLGNLLKTSIQQGIDLAAAGIDVESMFSDISANVNIDDGFWKDIADKINAYIKENGLKIEPITIDVKTGSIKAVTEDAKKASDAFRQAASAVGSIGSALESLEDPGAKVAGIIANAIATLAQTFAASLKGTFTPWDWIAGAAAGTATLISTITAVKNATKTEKHAGGGFIKGNSFSGDNITMPIEGGGVAALSSGELVLNRAQQGNLASQLQDGMRGNGFSSQPYVYAEQIWLGLENMLKRQGRGEIVTTKG